MSDELAESVLLLVVGIPTLKAFFGGRQIVSVFTPIQIGTRLIEAA